ncbi:unnamed protein product [Rhizopus microsporus]
MGSWRTINRTSCLNKKSDNGSICLFQNLKLHENRDNAKLAFVNFVASSQVSEALAQSGHLALSAPSQIIGQFQYLKTLNHDNLCEYVEIH